MLSIGAEKSKDAFEKFSSAAFKVASKDAKFPDTFEIIMCRTLKPTSLCIGSIFQVVIVYKF
jgi:hypothetical protein